MSEKPIIHEVLHSKEGAKYAKEHHERFGKKEKKEHMAKKMHPVSGHSQWLTQQVKKDNPAYYAMERRALKARRKK